VSGLSEKSETSRRRGRRRWWALGTAVLALATFVVIFAAASGANLTGSNFESNDGNLVVDTNGHTDWKNVAGLRTLLDQPSGSDDNSFTQGSKEDDLNVTVAAGSIPPNKNDLTRSYIASENTGGQTFLYLAWERLVNTGSANIDFELDQNATTGWTGSTLGPVTINRTEGDLLITYDFSGSGTPTIGINFWLTAGHGHSDSDCTASGGKLPCWGNHQTLDATGPPPTADGAVNTGNVVDDVTALPVAPTVGTLGPGLFGEAALNLSAIPGVFTPDQCTEFGTTFVKSRSSGSSVDAELKDFIAPSPIQVTNCVTPTVGTTLKNAAGNTTVANGSTLPINSSVYDTAQVSASDANPLTGTVTFQYFTNDICSGTPADTQTGVAVNANSFTKGPLGAGDYSFRAMYVAGNDHHHNNSAWSDCEPFSIAKGTPSATTTLKNVSGDATVANGSSLAINSSLYDTAGITAADGLPLTGTVSFQFFTNGTCTAPAADTQTGVAVGTKSADHGPLGAGSYSFRAMYVAGSDPNHTDSAWSDCEPFSINKGTPSASTTLKNVAGDATVANGTTLDAGSSLYDTAQVTAGDGLPLTGTVSFEFFTNGTCTAPAADTQTGVAVGTKSADHGPLAAGNYGFRAMYVAGSDPNHTDSAWSSCEPFSIGKGTPSASTTLKNAANDTTVTNGSSLAINSSLYDTAQITAADNLPLTGTLSYQFFTNGTCTTPAADTQTGVAVGTKSASHGPLAAGNYSFRAMYAAGSDPNHNNSAWSDCEPFSIGKGTPSASTTLKNAANDAAIANGTTLDINSTLYDTAQIAAGDGLPLTGTVSFQFFTNGTCTAPAADTQTGVAVGTKSADHGPLAAGNYSFRAMYVAGSDPNHNDSDWSGCEPFSIGKGTPSASTTLKNAANDTTVANGSSLAINSSLYDTAHVTAADGRALTGTLTFQFFTNGDCTTPVASTQNGVALGGQSDPTGPLGAGNYSFRAMYVAGSDPNHNDSPWSDCEPFSINKGTPSASTTLKNAADDTTVDNGSELPISSSLYDTAQVTAADGRALTGTLTFQFFANGTCTGEPVSTETGVAVDGHSSPAGPLAAGHYGFRAMYVAGNDPNHNDSAWSDCEPFSIARAMTELATTLSAESGSIGDTVHDSSTLSGATAHAGGTVTYTVYTNDTCTAGARDAGTKDVTDGVVPDSDGLVFDSAGTYYWQAVYSGDDNNAGSTSPCKSEILAIAKNRPTIATTLSSDEVVVGSSVHDSAKLTGATATAGGTVTYTVYTNDTCTAGARDAGTKSVSDGSVPDSNALVFQTAGDYYWQASYSGDANNTASTSTCTEEHLLVDRPAISITKNPKSQSIDSGGTANFTITVTNTGTTTLTGVAVTDAQAPDCAKSIGTLKAGESSSYSCSLAGVTSPFTNSATATGHPPVGPDVTATDTAPVTVNAVPPPPPPAPPAPKVDIQITKTATPDPATVGKQVTWTMVVTNNGPNNATGVTVADPVPAGMTFVSVTSSAGTCTGGALVSCQLGNLNVGGSVTITLLTTATATGTITNTTTTVAKEQETNTANNTASANVTVNGAFVPPVTYCTAVAVSPKQLFVGRKNTLMLKTTQHGKAKAGVKVRVKGSTLRLTTKPSNGKGVIKQQVKPMKAGIVVFSPITAKSCKNPRIGVIGVFTPPVTG
jgi:uncharacterized repeat protein (TIGR01451 family)